MPTDAELLTRFAQFKDQAAFAQLVQRHINLVHGIARRTLRRQGQPAAAAEDIVQAVFWLLARRAARLHQTALPAWLFTVTRYCCRDLTKREARQKRLQREAAMHHPELTTTPSPAIAIPGPSELSDLLDHALARLGHKERQAILIRYLQAQTAAQTASLLGISIAAVDKRLERGLAKLRQTFANNGFTVPAAAVATLMIAESAHAAPPSLAASTAAVTTGANAVSIAKGASTLMAHSTAKIAAMIALAAAFIFAGPVLILRSHRAPGASPLSIAAQAQGLPPPPAAAATLAAKPSDQLTHVREQIYILRHSVVGLHTPETYAAVRELVSIGKPAVPELCAELHRLDNTHDNAFRTLALTLRIIGDPRAVSALIDALPKTTGGGDCRDNIFDRDLWNFVNNHPLASDHEHLKYPNFHIPRSERQIIDALNTITHHTVSDSFDYNPDDTDAWNGWWQAHWEDFMSQEEANSVIPPQGKDDPVEAVGLAKFGPIFPTGPKIRVGPVHEVALEASGGWDSKIFIDFNTNIVSSSLDLDPASFAPYDPSVPPAPLDYDASCITYAEPARHWLYGPHLEAWRIDNARWDSIEKEVHTDKPLDLGKGGTRNEFIVGTSAMRTPDAPDMPPVTFLFRTSEGGRGIVQILGSFDSPPSVKFRYRMFEDPAHPVALRKRPAPPAPRPDLSFGPEFKVTLGSPLSNDPSTLDLGTGEKRPAPADAFVKDSFENVGAWHTYFYITAKTQEWLARWHGDLIVDPPGEGEKLWSLQGVDMAAFILSPDAWTKVTPGQLTTVFAVKRPEKQRFLSAYTPPAGSIIFAFKTREGAIGLLQVLEGSANPQSLTFRYKLVKGLTPVDTRPAPSPPKKPATENAASVVGE